MPALIISGILLAVFILAVMRTSKQHKKGGCGGCSGCAAANRCPNKKEDS